MILRGWKDICRAAGGMSAKTLRKLARTEDFPVVYIAGSPQTTDALIEAWIENHVKSKLAASEGRQGPQGASDEPA